MARKDTDCESEYQNMVQIKALDDRRATPSRRASYLPRIYFSSAKLETVRMADTASEARAALLANRLLVASSNLNSNLILT
jgi:hypothetical protein